MVLPLDYSKSSSVERGIETMSNDMIIVGTLMMLFVGVGFFLGNVNDAFGTDYDGTVTSNDDITGQESDDLTTVSGWSVITSIASMFLWTFGALPLWLDLIFLVFRAIFWTTIARNVWIGGGS